MFSQFFLLSLAVAKALAMPLEAETASPLGVFDLPTVQATFDKVQAGIDKMVKDVNAFTGDKAGMDVIVADSTEIQSILTEGVAKIKASPAMAIADALGILGPVGTLGSKVDEIVNALAQKKADLEKAGVAATV